MSHLDLTFMGSVEECLSRGGKVFSGVLSLLDEEPDFRFFLEYVLFLEAYRTVQPQAAERLDAHIRAGRIELGAEWSGIFVTQEDEEDLIRNVLYAKRYARERYGIELETLQLSDIPGAIPQLPQVCAGLGIKNLVVTRCAPAETLFWFQAPNGDRVLTWSSDQYNAAGRHGMHLGAEAMRERGLSERLRREGDAVPPLFYYGSDLFLPPPQLAKSLREWEEWSGQQIRITTPTGFFREMRGRAGVLEQIPSLSGELPSTWLYVEPDHTHVSRWDGLAARALDAAERLSTLAWRTLGLAYPKAELETLWKAQLMARDHNYGGKGAGEGQPWKLAKRREIHSRARRLIARAAGAIAERVESPRESVPVVVFNTLNWARSGVVHAHVTYYPAVDPAQRDVLLRDKAFVLRDPSGAAVPYQMTQDRRTTLGEFDLAFIARDVPGLGYASYVLEPAAVEEAAVAEAPGAAAAPRRGDHPWFGATPPDVVLENGLLRLAVSRSSGVARLFDLRGGTGGRPRQRVVLEGLGLEGRHELPEVMAVPPRALSYDDPPRETTEAPAMAGEVELVAQGPVLATAVVRQSVLGAPAQVRYTLYRELPWVDVEVRLDWDVQAFGRVELVYDVPRAEGGVRYGLPFGAGSFASESLMPGAGPLRGDEAAPDSWRVTREIARWLSVDDQLGGVVMATDHRWTRVDGLQPAAAAGPDASDGGVTVRCCLVRGGRLRAPSPEADGDDARVRLIYRFRFVPHDGEWRAAQAPHLGCEAVQPLLAYTVNDTWSEKTLPRAAALATVTATGQGQALLTCLKQSEDGEEVIARWFEASGAACAVRVEVPHGQRPVRADLQERLVEGDAAAGDAVTTQPWEIVTVRL